MNSTFAALLIGCKGVFRDMAAPRDHPNCWFLMRTAMLWAIEVDGLLQDRYCGHVPKRKGCTLKNIKNKNMKTLWLNIWGSLRSYVWPLDLRAGVDMEWMLDCHTLAVRTPVEEKWCYFGCCILYLYIYVRILKGECHVICGPRLLIGCPSAIKRCSGHPPTIKWVSRVNAHLKGTSKLVISGDTGG